MQMILATDKKWAIGCDGGLLVHLPGDLAFFKEKTLNKVVVMGRTTLESLPGGKPLPKRINVVMTRDELYSKEGVTVVHSIEELNDFLKDYNTDDVFIIGGEQVYKQFLPYSDTVYITKIYDEFKADRYFVNMDEEADFHITWESEMQEENGLEYQFFKYDRK